MCRQTGMTGNTLLQFILPETMGVTKINQWAGRQRPRPLGGERAFTIKRIVHVDAATVIMSANGYAATQMADYKIQVFVADRMVGRSGCKFGSIAAGNGSLIQRMPDGDARHQGRTCDASYLIQFIHYTGISNESPATGKQCSQFGSNETPQVTGMTAHGMGNVVQHGIIHFIYSTRNGFQQSSTPYDGIKFKRNTILLQGFYHQILAELKLVDDTRKMGKFSYRSGVVSSYTAIFVEVEPGLIARIFIIYNLTIYNLRLGLTALSSCHLSHRHK